LEDFFSLSTERYADSQFAQAFADGIRSHSENTDYGQDCAHHS